MKRLQYTFLIPAVLLGLTLAPATAGEGQPASPEALKQSVQKGIEFLKSTQADDGHWTTPQTIGITALCVNALVESGLDDTDPAVKKGLDFLMQYKQEDGGFYHPQSKHKNYETCIVLMALSRASKEGKYDDAIKAAGEYLRKLQWDEGEGLESSDTAYGGAGYGSSSRPDMSNTTFLIEALKAAGAKDDDPALEKALLFVSRSQNLETEANQTPFAAKVNDGGFYYTPAAGGTSQAGTTANGGLRSYASMTYAGLKSMIYAGVSMEDPRVQAAYKWIQKNYSVKENPGLGQTGLYYYFNVFAKSLDAVGKETIADASGTEHEWRKELGGQIISLQKENGSWTNSADRWYEGDPNLATAFSLMALSYCQPKQP